MKNKVLVRCMCLGILCFHSISFVLAQVQPPVLSSQTSHDLTKKYWTYRERLTTQFLKKGLGENGIASGYSLPAGHAYKSAQDQLHFGDATSFLGNYIGVLATEYLLLQRDGASLENILAVKEELYFAMKAYERVDFNAELLLLPHTEGAINGFFIRDDVDAENYLNDFPSPLDVKGIKKTIISDYTDAKNAEPCDRSPLRFPTVDQISNLMVGFALVVKCMGNESYDEYFFKDEAKRYTHIIMKYLQKVDYIIAHPIEGCAVAYAADARLIAYGLAQAGQAIKEERFGTEPVVQLNHAVSTATEYDSWNTFLSASVWMNTLNYPSGKAFFEANFNANEGDKLPFDRLKETINENGVFGIFDAHDYNNAIVCQLAAIGNVWKVGMVPHNRRITFARFRTSRIRKEDRELFDQGISLKLTPSVRERKISIPVCCYDATIPQQMIGIVSGLTHRRVPLADLSTQIITAMPTLCFPGHNVLPQVTINTTALALSKYGDLSDIQYFAVLHEFLHGTGVYNYDKEFLFQLLKEAPVSGPHYKPFRDPSNPPENYKWNKRSESEGSPWWRQDSRWEKSSRKRIPDEGAWNGLDYMIAYNLFHLVNGEAYGLSHYAIK